MHQSHQLPVPRVELWDWQQLGRCRNFDQAMFFGADGEDRPTRARRIQRAKQLCEDCPVLSACRDHALAAAEQHGIWGGLTPSERNALLASGPSNTLMSGVSR
ncbi:WhiB family transcriptional regulator [Mycolicibacterium neworleansense]|uniref:Transcriptional regulator WhiB n=1 Tax=Mycolicibacterium neworleansense TaxID=146018 RepID=A0A0H5RXG0_9MYCO|nr:WhiB family transcriptional regulator [Mycolicibacterium neworleansense]MCV7362184.1 WhiB family transcriptional regulator [Mycolicibacterium neworleansense]CRZ13409.1 transcription factor WhiB [Mycolicibacterium neworleansense]